MDGFTLRAWLPALAGALALLTGPGLCAVRAQALQTGVIAGTVLDIEAEPIPGVHVTVTLDSITVQRVSTITDSEGRFRIPGLPPGIYRVEATAEGLRQQQALFINLRVATVETVSIIMLSGRGAPLPAAERGGPMFSLASPGLGGSFNNRILAWTPLPRNLTAAAELLPGILATGDGLVVHGSDVRSNTFLIDGVNVSDPYTGTAVLEISYDSVESIETSTGGRNVRLGKGAGGVINIVQAADAERWNGSFGFYALSDALAGRTEEEDPAARIEYYDYSASLGSPASDSGIWLQGDFSRNNHAFSEQVQPLKPREVDTLSISGRTSFRTSPNNTITGLAIYNNIESLYHYAPNLSQWIVLESDPDTVTSDLLSDTWFFNLRDSLRVSEIMEMRLSASWMRHDTTVQPTSGDRSTTGKIDPAAYIIYQGSLLGRWEEQENQRLQIEGGIDFYLDELAGTHDILLGLEFERSENNSRWGDEGLFNEHYRAGQLLYRTYYAGREGAPASLESQVTITRFSIYGQDSWMPLPRLAVSLGIRYNGPQVENSFAQTVDWDDISPRLSINWDPFGDGHLVVRGGFSRYHESAIGARALTDPYGLAQQFWSRGLIAFGYGSGVIPGDPWGAIYNTFTNYGYAEDWNTRVNLDTTAPRTDEYFATVEWEPLDDTAIGLTLIARETSNILEDREIALWDRYIPFTRTATDGRQYTWWQRNPYPDQNGVNYSPLLLWDNDERLFRDHYGIEIFGRSRSVGGFRLFGNYTYGITRGNIDVTAVESTSFSLSQNVPALFENAEGYLSSDIRHRLKTAVIYAAPFDLHFGAVVTWRTGAPYNRYLFNPDLYSLKYEIRADPRGTVYRLDSAFILDLRFEKQIQAENATIGLIFDLFNLFNDRAVTAVEERDIASFGTPLERMQPRTFQFGIRYSF